jgi:transcriptional regulator with XRE-family HTH domain
MGVVKMNEEIRLIAERIRDMREITGFAIEELAQKCGITIQEYMMYEKGEKDFNFSFLFTLAGIFKIDIVDILSGDVPKLTHFSVVKKDKGLSITRVEAYKYQHLAYTFRNKKFETFMVTVEAKDDIEMKLNFHEGQEFNYVIEGNIMIKIGKNEIELEEGDSIHFDSSYPHGMKALNGKRAKFLAVVSK